MSESKHTPGPIHANSAGIEGHAPGPVVRIVRIWGTGFTSSELADAVDDMRYIEKAYNCHDELVEALESVIETLDRNNVPVPSYLRRDDARCRAAIAKAIA